MGRWVHLRSADRPMVPWRNGGGMTAIVAAHPASGDEWEWRISMALVDRAGPFSTFENVDRVLLLLSGALGLQFAEDGSSVELLPGAVARFPGDKPTFGAPRGGMAADLNIMTLRGRWDVRVECVVPLTRQALPLAGDFLLILFTGPGALLVGDDTLAMTTHDALLMEDVRGVPIELHSDSAAYLIHLSATRSASCLT